MADQVQLRVGILRDMIKTLLLACAMFIGWFCVIVYCGDLKKLDSGFITFPGGVLAVSGLLFRQYMLKEVLDYLQDWTQMRNILNKIIDISLTKDSKNKLLVDQFIRKEHEALCYSKYVRRELAIIPIVPLILVFLYGCALLAEDSLLFRAVCLFAMIFCVAYLAITALTSTKLACERPNLTETIDELKKLQYDLETGSEDGCGNKKAVGMAGEVRGSIPET